MFTIRFTNTQLISLIRKHTYMHMHTGGRWWQRAVMAYFALNIQIGAVLDEDLHHLQMAFRCGGHERGHSQLSETDTHSERDTTACHHTSPHTDNYLKTNTHTHIHTFIQYAYPKTLAHPYVNAYIHTYIMGIHTYCAHRDTSLLHT